jgi:CDP-diacylglycerol--serine O-phosphatidyltransferase
MVSFGIAPAYLMLKFMERRLTGIAEPNPVFADFIGRFIWLTAAVYMSCAAIRLARFNVENEQDESAHMSFMGLPSPAAAGGVVSLVIFHQDIVSELSINNPNASLVLDRAILYVLPFLALGAAVLMVSRIRYQHVLNQYIKGKKPFAHLIKILLGLCLIIWSWQAALVLIFCGFAASGFIRWFYYKVICKTSVPAPVTKRPAIMTLGGENNSEQDESL